jgi:hypothetical protein
VIQLSNALAAIGGLALMGMGSWTDKPAMAILGLGLAVCAELRLLTAAVERTKP